jgi:hypothetical protein
MRRSSSWLLRGTLAAISLLALANCVEGTTSSGSATAPNEAIGSTSPGTPATPATPTAPISPLPATTAVTPPVAATPSTVPTVAATATAPTGIPSTGPAAGAAGLAGTWESASCGARTYPRRITFAEPASFTAEDLVSPCPKGTTCVWSGIINRSGTYKVAKDLVTLSVSKTGNGPAKTQFPESLTLDASRAPVEAGSDGKPCAYKHAGSDRKP